ncbi:MAG: 50S ribosomal protein L22 [Myxococcales bacterium]|nr:50S ribosomal protein L22 [Myxococcales bacterium]
MATTTQDPRRVTARLSHARVTPRKLRSVVELIRGKPVEIALNNLRFCQRHGAPLVSKLLRSAVANAEANHDLDVDRLVVAEVRVDGGPTLKRFHSGPMGRGMRILKRTSHVSVVLTEK